MTTKRLEVNQKAVNWFDGQQVSESELDDEQLRNENIDAANIANFFGSGVLESSPTPNIIFDTSDLNTTQQSLLDAYAFDGQNVYVGTPIVAVTDVTYGVNLAVTLTDVSLAGAALTKVCIIGDSFGDELIHDDMVFNENGTKITRGRYKNIRAILFNNFAGNIRGSKKYALDDGYNWVGKCIIREAESLEVSYDTVMASQEQQPNQFFRDFVPGVHAYTILQMLQDAVGADKSVADLNIALASVNTRTIVTNDVTTRIGQKFLALGKNIQKISTLLSVKYDPTAPPGDGYEWSGSITMELHKLQTDVECPVTPVPDTALDFDPDPAIVAYITLTKDDLERQGVVLSGTAQVIDFVFTGTAIANPNNSVIDENTYYMFALGRSGDTHTGTLVFEEASDRYDSGYMVIYDGAQWINIVDSDLWFVIEGDYVKISDGIAYADGVGVEIPKIKPDETNTEAPYIYGLVPFYTVQHDAYNYVLLEETNEYSESTQDQRTGNLVYSRVTPAPLISLISASRLNTLRLTEPAPVLLGRIYDKNPKSNTENITGTVSLIGQGYGNEFNILWPDADVRTFNLVGSILIPNVTNSAEYRVITADLINDAYGDINGDGKIDATDLAIINSWLPDGYDLSDSVTQAKIAAGSIALEKILRADVNGDGVVDAADALLIENYIDKVIHTFPAGSTLSRMHVVLENLTSPLTTTVSIQTRDTAFVTVPFAPINWKIEYYPTWIADNLIIEGLTRLMPTTFTDPSTDTNPAGKNNFFIPGDLLLEGRILNPEGTVHTLDMETVHVMLNIPILDSGGHKVFLDGYVGIDLFETFVAESSEGKTAYGFDAMKYSDGTYVQMEDFAGGKVRINPALQSIANEFSAFPIKDIVGIYYDPDTSLMTLYVDDVYDDGSGNLLPPLSTKVLVSVFLKKAGFINDTKVITQAQMRQLLGI